jgi:hypothetical protein
VLLEKKYAFSTFFQVIVLDFANSFANRRSYVPIGHAGYDSIYQEGSIINLRPGALKAGKWRIKLLEHQFVCRRKQ